MTEEDKYALKELLRGFGVFAGASILCISVAPGIPIDSL